MHDMLRKMLKVPVFLDSSALSDLRNLVTDGVHKSDTLVLLATKGVLTRPWCLIELLETYRKGIPVIVVKLSNLGFEYTSARQFALNLKEEMEAINPAGMSVLHQHIGPDLTELRDALLLALEENERPSRGELVFDPHAGDSAMVATMKDVVERMAEETSRNIQWLGSNGKKLAATAGTAQSTSNRAIPRQASLSSRRLSLEMRKKPLECAVYVTCSAVDGLNHARVMRSELEIKLARTCAVGGDADVANIIPMCELLVVLLTKGLLTSREALLEISKALDNGKAVVTVSVTGGGYDYAEAAKTYLDLPGALNAAKAGSAAEMAALLPAGLDVQTAGARLHANLTSIIAIAWSPAASRNQTLAVVNDVCSRLMKANFQAAVKRTMAMERERNGEGARKKSVLNIASLKQSMESEATSSSTAAKQSSAA
mmetsp:Transcript_15437/g.46354  ORF Transcript_15437/g.46354 Transcript_15437/m.46354 type:complete len:428 (+) Transcript_15437:5126-6409(+)